MPQAFCSSCATYLRVRRMTLPYLGCLTRSSTITMTVLSILSLTTSPSRTLRYPRACCSCVAGASLILFAFLQRHDAECTLPHDRVNAGDLLADSAQPAVALQL